MAAIALKPSGGVQLNVRSSVHVNVRSIRAVEGRPWPPFVMGASHLGRPCEGIGLLGG